MPNVRLEHHWVWFTEPLRTRCYTNSPNTIHFLGTVYLLVHCVHKYMHFNAQSPLICAYLYTGCCSRRIASYNLENSRVSIISAFWFAHCFGELRLGRSALEYEPNCISSPSVLLIDLSFKHVSSPLLQPSEFVAISIVLHSQLYAAYGMYEEELPFVCLATLPFGLYELITIYISQSQSPSCQGLWQCFTLQWP